MDPILESKIIEEIPQDDSTTRDEKMILFEAIKKTHPKIVIETGTHRGLTSLYMMAAMQPDARFHTADPYDWGAMGNFRKFPELEKISTFYDMKGIEMLARFDDKSIDFAFIDGFHEKHIVLEEINVLLPKLKDGAVVFFHDTIDANEHCDVPGAIDEAGLKVEYLKTQNGMAKYVHKPKTVGKVHKATTRKKTVAKTAPRKRADKLSKTQ